MNGAGTSVVSKDAIESWKAVLREAFHCRRVTNNTFPDEESASYGSKTNTITVWPVMYPTAQDRTAGPHLPNDRYKMRNILLEPIFLTELAVDSEFEYRVAENAMLLPPGHELALNAAVMVTLNSGIVRREFLSIIDCHPTIKDRNAIVAAIDRQYNDWRAYSTTWKSATYPPPPSYRLLSTGAGFHMYMTDNTIGPTEYPSDASSRIAPRVIDDKWQVFQRAGSAFIRVTHNVKEEIKLVHSTEE